MSRELELAWAAGLFEGEGCMSASTHGKRGSGCQMRLGMTDRDVVERFARIVGSGNVYEHSSEAHREKGWKPVYQWVLYRASEVIPLLESLMPWFGERRRAKAEEVLAVARSISPRNERTHCPQGHPYSGDNLILEPIKRRMAGGEVKNFTYIP